jgi:DNA-binding CsgD family transcriptional regulator
MAHKYPVTMLTAVSLLVASSTMANDYDLQQLPMPPGWNVMLPTDMNDNGHVIGVNTDGFWFMPSGFYFDGTDTLEFGQDLKDQQPYKDWEMGIRPLAINNHNHVLLNLEIVDVGVFPYVWNGEDYFEVDPAIPDGPHDYADAGAGTMNNLGQIGGAMRFISNDPMNLWYRGFIWDPGTDTTIVIDPPPPFTDSTVFHMSDTGWVTGYVSGGDAVATGYIWKDGVMTLFEGIDEDDYLSISQRINDHGYAGAFTTNLPDPGQPSMSRVFLWSIDGNHHWSYPTNNLTGFQVYGINNNHEVVGTMYGPQQPFHFHNGVLRNLNNHITSPIKGVTLDLWDAAAINAAGQIAVMFETPRPAEMAPLIMQAYQLTKREGEITGLILRGLSTAEIAAALHISSNTVQDHLKPIFEKVNVRSRRELTASIFGQQYQHHMIAGAPVDAAGQLASLEHRLPGTVQ